MNRRFFIRQTSIAGITLPLATTLGCDNLTKPNQSKEKIVDNSAFELDEETIDGLQEKMKSGALSAERIAQLYLDRINAIDKSGPKLNSVIEINPDALSIARALDEERKSGKIRGPLHGIPVLIKDNINTGDKMMTTAGSLALQGHRAPEDAFIVKKLRDAGAVIIGKTNLSEWANFRSTRSSSGWSSRGGQTRNPYVLDRNPCGSSSGSGAAVSANLCAVAIGTETNGSIACPSSINGVVGFKPTVGVWSRTGIIPISVTQDTAGPMTRTVLDAAILLEAIAAVDPEDPAGPKAEGRIGNYVSALDTGALKGRRIGIEKKFLKVHEGVDALFQKAIEQIRGAGAEVVEVSFLERINLQGAGYEVLLYEFKDGINKYLDRYNAPVKSLEGLIAFNRSNEKNVMPYFKQEIFESAQEKKGLDAQEYKDALAKVLSVRKTIDDTLKEFRLDAMCGPANGPSWCTDLVNGDSFTGYGMYSPAARAGYPHVIVPMGFVSGLPIGLCFFNSAYQEQSLLAIAYAYEQLSKNRLKPGFLKTLADQ